jgi:hypothetical protein
MKRIILFITTIVLSTYIQTSWAQTSTPTGACLTYGEGSNNAAIAFNEVALQNHCSYPVAGYICYSIDSVEKECTLAAAIANGLEAAIIPQIPLGDGTAPTALYGFECPFGTNTLPNGGGTAFPNSAPPACITVTNSTIAAAVLPNAFASEIDKGTTVFATMQNTKAGQNCRVALQQPVPSSFEFSFQQTNPSTNTPIGNPNTPVSIMMGGSATFVLDFASLIPFVQQGVPLVFSCDGSIPVPSIVGLSSVDFNFTIVPTANIVALGKTESNNGILTVPVGGVGAFAVASDNAGNTGAIVVVTADTGSASLPVTITLCQTNPSTAACLATPAASVTTSIAQGGTPTFSVFVTASSGITFAPASNRVFLRFKVNGIEVGATSVAIQT